MADVMSIVTDRIIAALEEGTIPWHKPWVAPDRGAYNRISGKKYSLLNQLMLQHEGEYASYKQWTDLGGQVRKGEKAEIVVFWKWPEDDQGKEDLSDLIDEDEKKKKRPVLRYYCVFHISQVDGVEPLQKNESKFEHDPIDAIDHVLVSYVKRENILFDTGNYGEAYYSPGKDLIHIPGIWLYENPEEYYSTASHEAVHSTGSVKRLGREGLKKVSFGSEIYSKEELIAEIGSAALMAMFGIETEKSFENSVAYLQGWLRALRDDRRMLVVAAGQAEKAMNFILGN